MLGVATFILAFLAAVSDARQAAEPWGCKTAELPARETLYGTRPNIVIIHAGQSFPNWLMLCGSCFVAIEDA